MDETTNPAGDEDRAPDPQVDGPEVEPAAGVEPSDEAAAEGAEPEAGSAEPEPAEAEIEHDGRVYRVPLALKDAFLRQADYTRKTQDVAEQRRAVEAERQAVRQATEAELGAYAQATASGAQIEQIERLAASQGGWAAWVRSDPAAAQEAHMTRSELDRARQQAIGQLGQLRQQRETEAQQETARRIGEASAVLEREIGWSPAKAAELLEGGIREYRFERSEIERFEDARMVLALNDALQWRAHQKQKQAAARHEKAQEVKPAAKVQARSAPPSGLDDRLSADEWVRRRNRQVRG